MGGTPASLFSSSCPQLLTPSNKRGEDQGLISVVLGAASMINELSTGWVIESWNQRMIWDSLALLQGYSSGVIISCLALTKLKPRQDLVGCSLFLLLGQDWVDGCNHFMFSHILAHHQIFISHPPWFGAPEGCGQSVLPGDSSLALRGAGRLLPPNFLCFCVSKKSVTI